MFCEIIAQVFSAGAPVYVELMLMDAITDPVEPHIHGLGAALFHGVVCKAGGCGVVGFDGRGWLRMTHVS